MNKRITEKMDGNSIESSANNITNCNGMSIMKEGYMFSDESTIIKEELIIFDESEVNENDLDVEYENTEGNKSKSLISVEENLIKDSLTKEEEEIILVDLSGSSEGINFIPDNNTFAITERYFVNLSEGFVQDDPLDISELSYLTDNDTSNYCDDCTLETEKNTKPAGKRKLNSNFLISKNITKPSSTVTSNTQELLILNTENLQNSSNIDSQNETTKKAGTARRKNVNKNVDLSISDSGDLHQLLFITCRNCNIKENAHNQNLKARYAKYNKIEKHIPVCNKCESPIHFLCKVCTSEFNNLNLAERHVKKFHSHVINNAIETILPISKTQSYEKRPRAVQLQEPLNFYCKKCDLPFRTVFSLEKHEMGCQIRTKLCCKFCPLSFYFKKEVKRHITLQHQEQFNIEELGDIIKEIVKNAQKLNSIVADSLIGKCRKCLQTVKLQEYERICKKCFAPLTYQCGVPGCFRVYNRFYDLVRHVKINHSPGLHVCRQCKQIFNSRAEAESHQINCINWTRAKRVRCSNCSFVAPNCTELEEHVLEHHPQPGNDARYKCVDCGKAFKEWRWYQSHTAKFCSQVRQYYKCAHCAYKTQQKQKLQDHLQCNHLKEAFGRGLICSKCRTEWTSIYKFNTHIGECSGSHALEMAKLKKRRKTVKTESL